MNRLIKRTLCWICAFTLVGSMFPATALADEIANNDLAVNDSAESINNMAEFDEHQTDAADDSSETDVTESLDNTTTAEKHHDPIASDEPEETIDNEDGDLDQTSSTSAEDTDKSIEPVVSNSANEKHNASKEGSADNKSGDAEPNAVSEASDFVYSLNTEIDGIVISGYNGEVPANLEIPSEIDGKPVKVIGSFAFHYSSSIQSVSFPSTLQSIETYAFAGCGLEKITFNEGINSVGSGAFYWATPTEPVSLPASLTKIGDNAFWFSGGWDEYWGDEDQEKYVINTSSWSQYYKLVDNSNYINTENTIVNEPDASIPKGDLEFSFEENTDGTLTITGITGGFHEELTIPSEYEGKKVSAIGEFAFSGLSWLRSIKLPEGLVEIGESAFQRCPSITEVVVPKNCNLKSYAFAWCESLASVVLSEGVTALINGEENASFSIFSGCSKLSSVEFPESFTVIGYSAFSDCRSLKSVSFPVTLKSIKSSAFMECPLEHINLPEGVESVGNHAFYCAVPSEPVTLPTSLTDIGESSLYFGRIYYEEDWDDEVEDEGEDANQYEINASTWGQYYKLEDNDSYINTSNTIVNEPDPSAPKGELAFSFEENPDGVIITGVTGGFPEELTIPSEHEGKTVVGIGERAFRNARWLKAITLPAGLALIEEYAFYGCSNLTEVSIPAGCDLGNGAFGHCSGLERVVLPEGVTTSSEPGSDIEESGDDVGVFNGCSSLKEVDIPSTLNQGGFMFSYCTSLERAHFASNAKIGEGDLRYWFYECTSLTDVELPSTLETIGERAFENCTSLKRISLPITLKAIGWGAFVGCPFEEINLPDGIEEIGGYAFFGSFPKSTVDLPASLAKIDDYAFCFGWICDWWDGHYRADDVQNMHFSIACSTWLQYYKLNENDGLLDSETTVVSEPDASVPKGDLAFSYHEKDDGTLTIDGVLAGFPENLPIPESIDGVPVTTISDSAFKDARWMKSVDIPDCISEIGTKAFARCSRLAEVVVPSNCNLKSSVFDGCKSLTSVVLQEGVTAVEGGEWSTYASGDIFQGCSKLTNVIIPESISTIGGGMFQDCTSLKSISFPNSLKIIERWAFYNCPLESINLPNGVVEIEWGAFHGATPKSEVVLPASLKRIDFRVFMFGWQDNKLENPGPYKIVPASMSQYMRLIRTYDDEDGDVIYRCYDPTTTTLVGYDAEAPSDPSTSPASSDYSFSVNSDGTATITGLSDQSSNASKLVIPSEVVDYSTPSAQGLMTLAAAGTTRKVTAIGANAFKGNNNIVSVFIPDTVVSIGESSFEDCSKLSVVVIPSSVREINDDSFSGIEDMTIICEEDSVACEFAWDQNFEPTTSRPLVLADASCAESVTYSKAGCKPKVNVSFGTISLKEGVDYEVVYENNSSAGQAKAIVKALDSGSYTGSKAISFKIVPCSVSSAKITLSNTSFTYTGSELKPTVSKVIVGADTLATSDYTVAYKNNVNVGTATVTITGKGNYTGSASVTFSITAPATQPNPTPVTPTPTPVTPTPTPTPTPATPQPAPNPVVSTPIVKAANTMTVKAKAKVLNAKFVQLKKKAVSITKSAAFKIAKAVGKVTFKKSSGNNKIVISTAGKITIKKGLKKGTYSIKVKVTAAGNAKYKSVTKTVTIKIKVK